nr:hypothetical protein [Paracoccus aerius]
MRKIADKRRRFCYGRMGIMLECKGMVMNEKKLDRVCCEEGLLVPEVGQRKRPGMALHRSRKAAAGRLHRVIQRQPGRQAPGQRDL